MRVLSRLAAASVAGLAVLWLSLSPAASSQPFDPVFDLSIASFTPGANTDATLETVQVAGENLVAAIFVDVPPGVDIAADNAITDGAIVGTGILKIDFGCDDPIHLDSYSFTIIESGSLETGQKNSFTGVGVPFITILYEIDGSVSAGHVIETVLFNNGSGLCTPMEYRYTLFGRTSDTNQPVITSPTIDGLYTWQSTYWNAPLAFPPGHEVIACDEVPIGTASPPPDSDGDGISDNCDTTSDLDSDGVIDGSDNCRNIPNPGQEDVDGDGIGDLCDTEVGVAGVDDCGDGLDNDGDGLIDGADPGCTAADSDNDGVPDAIDNCPNTPNPTQTDVDGDGVGEVCDNCPDDPNPSQTDTDGDGIGDLCDPTPGDVDKDGDGVLNTSDNCPNTANANQSDVDGDGIGDLCDPFPNDPDNDKDGDGISGDVDNCPNTANPTQIDSDGDGLGDACDPCPANPDCDNDGYTDAAELYIGTDPQFICSWPPDAMPAPDGDGIVAIDDVTFAASAFGSTSTPRAESSSQNGTVGIDDVVDFAGLFGTRPDPGCIDTDGDGLQDIVDNCPNTSNPGQADNDLDGLGDACDPDDDNDGWTDLAELYIGTDPLNAGTPGGCPPDPAPAPDGNGIVQIDDVTFGAAAFGSTTTPRAEIASQNGTVQIDDVTAFASRFGDICS